MPTTKTPSIQPHASSSSSEQTPRSEQRPRSLPPSPPSARPPHERPASILPSPLPPPASSRLPAPSLPPPKNFAPTPVPEEVERLELEASNLRKRLSTQRQETKIEQKNNELLRNEIALLKTKLGKQATPNEAELEAMRVRKQIEQEHREELRQEKMKLERSEALLLAAQREHQEAEERFAKELESLRHELKAARESNHSGDLKALKRELETLQRSNTSLEHRLTELTRERNSLKAKLTELSHRPPASMGDDLTRIKGIGPTFAKALHAAGIRTFAAIAAWTDKDIQRIAPLIKTTPARIEKSDWIQSAKGLLS